MQELMYHNVMTSQTEITMAENTLRFVILILIGFLIAVLWLLRLQRTAQKLAQTEWVYTEAVMVQTVSIPDVRAGHRGYLYYVRLHYTTQTGERVETVCENNVHAPTDYPVGSTERIRYDAQQPTRCLLIRDRNTAVTNWFPVLFGTAVMLLGAILLILHHR